MKHSKFAARFAGLLLVGTALLVPQTARAQGGMPDLSDFAGAIAKSAQNTPTAAKTATKPGTLFKTDLVVPRVNPGSGASAVGKMFREKGVEAGGPEEALKQLETAMPQILEATEAEMKKNDFAPRDMGVAVGVSLLQLWEDATKSKPSEQAETVATKSFAIATAQKWGPSFKKLPAAQQEQVYEKLLAATVLNAFLIAQFDEAGKTEDADGMRAASGELFEQLVGVPASSMKIAADGTISGLAAQ